MSYAVNTGAATVLGSISGTVHPDREALAALLHDLFRARLEELVKGMPLSDGGLRLTADVAVRVAVLCRTNFEFLEPAEQERARADADRLLGRLAETT